VLSYKISELVGEGRNRENAILALYEREGKITLTEARELGKAIRKEKEETIEKQIEEHKKSLETLSVLFSKGELTEESYEAAIKPLEDKIARLEREKKEDEIKVLEEKLAKLQSVNREEATPKPKRESIELPAPPPTAPTKRLGFKTISKYFMHGFAFSLIMLALLFVWVFVLVFLTVAGSFIGLVLGFVVLLFILSGVNSFLTESICMHA
jgi:predicted RND superfamily exporter protein